MERIKHIFRFYGMSGTFKGTSIKAYLKGREDMALPIFSLPKPWKKLEKGVLRGHIQEGNNMNLAALTLCTLQHTLWVNEALENGNCFDLLLAERGVLDNMWYWTRKEGSKLSAQEQESVVSQVRREELRIEEELGWEEWRNLVLIMEDEDFIDSHILSEPTRRQWFPDVQSYLEAQRDYINFLRKHIPDLRERRIENAAEYLRKLGIDYKQ